MADSENNPACALRNAQLEVKTLLYELRIILEALAHGVKTLLTRPDAQHFKGELDILESFANQAVDALEGYQASIDALLGWSPEAAQG